MTDADIRDALNEEDTVALTLWGEARGEPIEGIVAVGCVIRNRVEHPKRFGRTYKAVCHARAQFSCWWASGGRDNYQRVMAMAQTLASGAPLIRTPSWIECRYVAEGIISRALRDRVKGADHYYAPAGMPYPGYPFWAKDQTPVAVVGAHRFFKL